MVKLKKTRKEREGSAVFGEKRITNCAMLCRHSFI